MVPGWKWFDITGQPAPGHNCHHREKDLPYIQPEFLLFFFFFILCLLAHYFFILCLFTSTAVKSLTPSPRWPLHGHRGLLVGPPQSCLFSRLNQPSSFCSSSPGKCSYPEHLGGPQLNSLPLIDAFLLTFCLPKMIAFWFWCCFSSCIKSLYAVGWSRTATAKVITGISEADDMTLHRTTEIFFWNNFFPKKNKLPAKTDVVFIAIFNLIFFPFPSFNRKSY